MGLEKIVSKLIAWNHEHGGGGPLRLVTNWGLMDSRNLRSAELELESAYEGNVISERSYADGIDLIAALRFISPTDRRHVFNAYWSKQQNERDWVV